MMIGAPQPDMSPIRAAGIPPIRTVGHPGGMIAVGTGGKKVIIRAIGPSLSIAGKLLDPTLELRDANGGLLRANDNWRTGGQEAEIIASTVPPPKWGGCRLRAVPTWRNCFRPGD